MADLVPLSLTTTTRRSRYRQEGDARLINAYIEEVGEEGKHPWVIYRADGLRPFGGMGDGGGIRAAIPVGTTLYGVADWDVYAVDGSGSETLLGSIATDGLVTMAVNRRQPNPQIALVSGGLYYLIENNVLTLQDNPNLPPPAYVFEVDGYFVFVIQDGRFFISGLNDGTTIDGLDFAKAEALSDPLVAGATRGRDVCLFGTRSTEFWQHTGDADFPFSRGQVMNIGSYAAGSTAECTAVINGATVDTIAWAATDEQGGYLGVMLLNGYSGQKISNHDLDRLIRDDPAPRDIRGFSWAQGGHVFYAISGTGYSYVYNTVTGRWNEWESYGLGRARVSCHAQFGRHHIFGDANSNRLYRLDATATDEAGAPIVATVQTPPVHAFPYSVQHHAVHVDVVVEDNQAPWDHDSAPRLMLDWSDDGGFTWATQREIPLGHQGARLRRAITRRLGTARSRTYRISWSDPRIRGIANAQLEVERLAS